jgi:hypothetical protein
VPKDRLVQRFFQQVARMERRCIAVRAALSNAQSGITREDNSGDASRASWYLTTFHPGLRDRGCSKTAARRRSIQAMKKEAPLPAPLQPLVQRPAAYAFIAAFTASTVIGNERTRAPTAL